MFTTCACNNATFTTMFLQCARITTQLCNVLQRTCTATTRRSHILQHLFAICAYKNATTQRLQHVRATVQRLQQQCIYNARAYNSAAFQRFTTHVYNNNATMSRFTTMFSQFGRIKMQQRSVYNAYVQQHNVYNDVLIVCAYNNLTLQRLHWIENCCSLTSV